MFVFLTKRNTLTSSHPLAGFVVTCPTHTYVNNKTHSNATMNCQLIPTLLISFLTYNAYAFAPYHRGSTFQRSSDKVKRGSVGSTYVQSYISHDRYTTALGATGGYMNVVPLGMGGAVPDTIITNVDMVRYVGV